MRIEILALTNLYLDIHEGILEFDLYLYLVSLQQPPGGLILFFDKRIEILTIKNLHLDIHEGILV